MKYITIFKTSDPEELSVIRNLFDDEKIDYKILNEENRESSAGDTVDTTARVQVKEDQREEARDVLKEGGFLGRMKPDSARKKPSINKWVFIFLAALVVVIVAILIVWFMNAN